jgi:hypothetical protein
VGGGAGRWSGGRCVPRGVVKRDLEGSKGWACKVVGVADQCRPVDEARRRSDWNYSGVRIICLLC